IGPASDGSPPFMRIAVLSARSLHICAFQPFWRRHAVTERFRLIASSLSSCWPDHIGYCWAHVAGSVPVFWHSTSCDVWTAVRRARSHSIADHSVGSNMSSAPFALRYQTTVFGVRFWYGSVHLLVKMSQREPGPKAPLTCSHSSWVPLPSSS